MTNTHMKTLYFETLGSGPPVLILHGLFGEGSNWHFIARDLSRKYKVFLIDLRNHGKSFHSDHFNYQVMADDLMEFIQHQGLHMVSVIGHSMGGKTAMEFAFRNPDVVHKLVVVDIANKAYQPIDDNIINALCSLDVSKISRLKEADVQLKKGISDQSLRLFLLKNLKSRNGDGYRWQINLNAIRNGNRSLSREVSGRPFSKPCLFVRGEYSQYIMDSDWTTILAYFPCAELVTLHKAGHWVHIDAREAFVAAVEKYLDR